MTRVTVLSHDVSHNCLGRADVLARLLAGRFDVQIVGPALGGRVWPPLEGGTAAPLRVLPARTRPGEIAAAADGDVLCAVKPRRTSLGAALRARAARGVPVLADVDDWELGFYLDDLPWALRNSLRPRHVTSVWSVLAHERLVRRADAVTVSGGWLQRRVGGPVVPHARSEPPAGSGERAATRSAWGLRPDEFAVVFLGSVRPHKIRSVLTALDLLDDPRVRLVLTDPEGTVPGRADLVRIPPVPFAEVQRVLAGADAVVLAQSDSRTGRAQVPAKVFDAMAAGLPVVASAVSDLPEILDGCGLLVPPDDPAAIASALRRLLAEPALAQRLGAAARERFRLRYRTDVVAGPLCDLVADLAARRVAVG